MDSAGHEDINTHTFNEQRDNSSHNEVVGA